MSQEQRNKRFIVHINLTSTSTTQVPIFAKDLEEASEFATEHYEDYGIEVVRITPDYRG